MVGNFRPALFWFDRAAARPSSSEILAIDFYQRTYLLGGETISHFDAPEKSLNRARRENSISLAPVPPKPTPPAG